MNNIYLFLFSTKIESKMDYFARTNQIKKFINTIDKQWFHIFRVFLGFLKSQEGFDGNLITLNDNVNIITMLEDSTLRKMLAVFVSNPNITLHILESFPSVEWDYSMISPEAQISMKFVLENKDRIFVWTGISMNKNITMDMVKKYDSIIPWDYQGISANPNLTIRDVEQFYEKKEDLDWFEISKHPNINMDCITSHRHFPWNSKGMSLNSNIPYYIVETHPFTQWDYDNLSLNPSIDMFDVRRNLTKPWSWNNLSSNPNIYIQFIRKFIDRDWNWFLLSSNPAITFKMMKENNDLPWDPKGISLNPNLTFDDISKNQQIKWDYENLCMNHFTYERNIFYRKKLKEYMMACKIQKFWRSRVMARKTEEVYEGFDTYINADGLYC